MATRRGLTRIRGPTARMSSSLTGPPGPSIIMKVVVPDCSETTEDARMTVERRSSSAGVLNQEDDDDEEPEDEVPEGEEDEPEGDPSLPDDLGDAALPVPVGAPAAAGASFLDA